jgi:sarcosine oxidase
VPDDARLLVYDAIVVGLGGMGSSALAHAAGRGMKVLGLEQFGRVHALGSSAGRSRIIRQAYFEDAAYVPLVQHAYDLWRELEAATGLDVLNLTGVLLVGTPQHDSVINARASAILHDLPFEELDAGQIARRYPSFAPRPDEIGIFEANAGFVVPEAAIEAHLRVAERAGAEMRFNTPLTRWRATAAGTFIVEAADGSLYETRRLALCMGAWFESVAAEIGIPIVIERRVQHWFAQPEGAFGPAALPTFLVDRVEQPSRMYGFPNVGDGVKAAFHAVGEITHADELDRTVHETDIEPLRAALEAWLPGSTAHYAGGKVCMYCLTPDEHFVLGVHPHHAGVVLAGGFSGHGFKFASAIGDVVADLLADGTTGRDVAFLSPARFTS